jgi:hypothetical protein
MPRTKGSINKIHKDDEWTDEWLLGLLGRDYTKTDLKRDYKVRPERLERLLKINEEQKKRNEEWKNLSDEEREKRIEDYKKSRCK